MNILHMMGGGDIGGAKTHIMTLTQKLKDNNNIRLISFRPGTFPEQAADAGIDVEVIYRKNPFSALKLLVASVDKFKPDIVHCHGGKANMMGALLKACRKIPIVSTLHSDYKLDYLGNPLKQYTFGLVNAISLRMLDFFIPVASRMKRSLITRGFNPQRLYTIYNGLDFNISLNKIDRKQYLKDLCGSDIMDDDVLCGIATRLTAVKDLPTAIRGFHEAHIKNHRLKFFIAGEGEDKNKLMRLCKELDMNECIYFCGWVSVIDDFFSAMDVTLLSSISETFPYTVSEGIRAGCVPLCSDVGGMNELVLHGQSGFLFSPGDEHALSDALLELCNDDLRIKMAKNAFERNKIYFSLDTMVKRQEHIYRSILDVFNRKGRQGVVLCGAYGKGNAGDDAILQAIVDEMRSIDEDMDIYVLSRRPKETRLNYDVNAVYTFNVFSFLDRFKKCKVYVNGGGSLIQDVTSSRSLYYYLFTLMAAKKLGSNVMMYGCGIGPVNVDFNRTLASKTINKYVDTITLRDDLSMAELSLMGVFKPDIKLSADPTLILNGADLNALIHAFREEGADITKKYIGFGLRQWKGFEDIAPALASGAQYAYDKYGLIPMFIPIEHPKDLYPAEIVSKNLTCPYHIIKKRYPIDITIAMLANMKMVSGIRLHSIMFSAGRGVPVIGISYDIKVDGFMKYIGSSTCISLKDLTGEKFCALIDICASGQVDDEVKRASDMLIKREHENILSIRRLLNNDK